MDRQFDSVTAMNGLEMGDDKLKWLHVRLTG